jgi:hypothetical protein
MPTAVAEVHHQLNAVRFADLMALRAFSIKALEPIRRAVFSQRIAGLGVLTQSEAMLRRIRKAAVKARKTTVLETSNR